MPSLDSFELPPRKTLADFLNQEPASSSGKNTVFAKVEKVPRKGQHLVIPAYALTSINSGIAASSPSLHGVTSGLRKQILENLHDIQDNFAQDMQSIRYVSTLQDFSVFCALAL